MESVAFPERMSYSVSVIDQPCGSIEKVWRVHMKAYPVGSVLKVPRHDTEEDLRRNLTLMRDHGLNTVVIWPAAFWWEKNLRIIPSIPGSGS